MVLRRLTKIEKNEILEEFRSGLTADILAKKYNCSANTINRTVKTLLTKEEYLSLKEYRSKIKKAKRIGFLGEESNKEKELLAVDKNKLKDVQDSKKNNLELQNYNNDEVETFTFNSNDINTFSIEKNDDLSLESKEYSKDQENNFEEIVPLVSSFGFETQEQKVDCKNLDNATLPESVYMLVEKKVELEPRNISDLPEWSFLPDNELERLAILLFPNQRTAKRNCSKNQKVIKIPDTGIFKISKSYLLSKGITRLILEDSLISLDS